MSDERYNETMQKMLARLEVHGVAAVKLADGELFAFTRTRLLDLLAQMDSAKQDRAIIIVKTRGDETPVVDN